MLSARRVRRGGGLVRSRRVRLRSGMSSGCGSGRGLRLGNRLNWFDCNRRLNNYLRFHDGRLSLLRSGWRRSHLNWLGLWRLDLWWWRRRSSSTVSSYALGRNQARLRRRSGIPATSWSMRGCGLRDNGLGRSNWRLWCSNLGGLDRMRTSGGSSRRVLFLFENSFQSVTGFGDL